MKLSIISICYNDKLGFEKTAKSILSQTSLDDVEWVIIDGGSTDGSAEFINEIVNTQAESTRTAGLIVYHVSEKDKGIYNAMNKGIRHANGDYLFFLNAGDCLYDEKVLEKVSPLLSDKDIYVGDIANDINGELELVEFPRNLTSQVVLDQLVFKLIPHQASFIKRNLFYKYGMYREDLRIASDWYFFYNALVLHSATIETVPLSISIFDMTGISSTDKNRVKERVMSQDDIPCQQEMFIFYRDNKEIVSAVNATLFGRLMLRGYFFIYRWFMRN